MSSPIHGSVPSRAAPRPGPGVILAVIGTGAAAVLALWWHSTPDVSGLGAG